MRTVRCGVRLQADQTLVRLTSGQRVQLIVGVSAFYADPPLARTAAPNLLHRLDRGVARQACDRAAPAGGGRLAHVRRSWRIEATDAPGRARDQDPVPDVRDEWPAPRSPHESGGPRIRGARECVAMRRPLHRVDARGAREPRMRATPPRTCRGRISEMTDARAKHARA